MIKIESIKNWLINRCLPITMLYLGLKSIYLNLIFIFNSIYTDWGLCCREGAVNGRHRIFSKSGCLRANWARPWKVPKLGQVLWPDGETTVCGEVMATPLERNRSTKESFPMSTIPGKYLRTSFTFWNNYIFHVALFLINQWWFSMLFC